MSLLQMSFAGTVMILAIIVIRALTINLLPKKTFLALWGIAVMRLLLPFSIPSAFSVYSLISSRIPAAASAEVLQAFEMLPVERNGQTAAMPDGISNTAGSISVWTIIWAVGVLACALVFAVAYQKCRQEFQTSLPVDNEFIRGWLCSHRLKRPFSVRQSGRFSAPLTYGVFCPVILMPTSVDWENTKSLQYVLMHEYVHIRRFDSIKKLVLIAVLCVHWFNPLVWAMYSFANRDMELSCDEAVVRLFGENTKAAYARSLISMEETRSGLNPLCNNFNKSAIEERITAIMKIKKASIFSLAPALALIFGVTIAFATSAAADESAMISDAPVSLSYIMMSAEQNKKTSIAAKSTRNDFFGIGENETYYEKDTKADFTVQFVYEDRPLEFGLAFVDNFQDVVTHKVESDEPDTIELSYKLESGEQITIELIIPADGNPITIKNYTIE